MSIRSYACLGMFHDTHVRGLSSRATEHPLEGMCSLSSNVCCCVLHVEQDITKTLVKFGAQDLGQNVCLVVLGRNLHDLYLAAGNRLLNEAFAPFDV